MGKRKGWDALPGIIGVILALAGNVAANVLSVHVSGAWEKRAPLALMVLTLAILSVSWLNGRIARSSSTHDSRT